MISETQIAELEHALLARARHLAEEYLARGEVTREQIIRDTNYHLRLREEREMLAAKALGDRTYRQLTQAGELQLQADMDRLRFALIRGVINSALEELTTFCKDDAKYLPLLGKLLRHCADSMPDKTLRVRINYPDYKRLHKTWDEWIAEHVPGRSIILDDEPLECIGGVLVEDEQGRERIDNTFEGRLERLDVELQQATIQRLFASLPDVGGLFNG